MRTAQYEVGFITGTVGFRYINWNCFVFRFSHDWSIVWQLTTMLGPLF